MNQKDRKPSRMALAFFNWYCHPDFKEEIEGDLMERFNIHAEKYGYHKANRRFVKEVLLLFRPALVGNVYHLTNTDTMVMTKQNKRRVTILSIAVGLLFIPLLAMHFSNDVHWKFFDFLVAGVLLIGTGLAFEFMVRKIKTIRYKILFGIVLFVALLLIWAELAVGIFGTPIAGS